MHRRRAGRGLFAALAALAVVSGCQSDAPTLSEPLTIELGKHSIERSRLSLEGITRVWYFRPDSMTDSLRAVIVMHGAGRNAEDYLDAWVGIAQEHGLLVIAPEFGEEETIRLSGRWEWKYNTGNMVSWFGRDRRERDWYFESVERLFDAFRTSTSTVMGQYVLFGHSAGGQFIHRMILFRPDARFAIAIAANSGWYTMPDVAQSFPYGLSGAPYAEERLDRALTWPLVVFLGLEDSPDQGGFRQSPEAMLQGDSRVTRGEAFFEAGKQLAGRRGVAFGWTLERVGGVGHDYRGMTEASMTLLLDRGLVPPRSR